MAVVTGANTCNIAITQVGALGIAAATSLAGAVLNLRSTFANGVGADQFNLLHAKSYPFLASTPQTIDLQNLLDQVGNAISFAVVRAFLYRIQANNAAYTMLVGGAGANEWNGLLTSGSKGLWYPSSSANDGFSYLQAPSLTGVPVSAGSRFLKLDPGTNPVGNVDIIIAGS